MALRTLIQFPIFAPPNPSHHRPATEVHFSRWNNANAEKFIRRERTQKEIEDQLRFHKRFNSADNIANIYENATATRTTISGTDTFKSTGTPSAPSRPSIPGKASKYSKNPKASKVSHPAFRPIVRPRKIPNDAVEAEAGFKVDSNGVSYKFPEAPFEYQYSYTETPKVQPLKLREPPIAPFGPSTMPRPWTGRKPLPPSKKKMEFDSFQLPPPHKKGVKPVQSPGPFLPGSGPKYVQSREEILGEPLTKEEVEELVSGCIKSKRQLNMGRDGLTHNMLDNIHAHWKRRRVCKIKCKGVCTVDMNNVRQQLEEKTGGKIIYGKGGVIYLFRGRNYNYKTRPRFPLMLWKPVTPVYPRLVQRVPEGLTLEEATEMRVKGRKLAPICKLGKNGVYFNLVKHVREAFEACELVRINCQGMNGSDYRKIGAKLKDLVPCVLISFEREHILVWRGRDWKSSLPKLKHDPPEPKKSKIDDADLMTSALDGHAVSESCASSLPLNLNPITNPLVCEDVGTQGGEDLNEEGAEHHFSEVVDVPSLASVALPPARNINESECPSFYPGSSSDNSEILNKSHESKLVPNGTGFDHDDATAVTGGSNSRLESVVDTENQSGPLSVVLSHDQLQVESENLSHSREMVFLNSPWTQGVLQLQKQAVESGSAVILDKDSSLDADIVFQKAVALAQSAPSGPVFRHQSKKAAIQKCEEEESQDLGMKDDAISERRREKDVAISERRREKDVAISERREIKNSKNQRMKDLEEDYLNIVPQGNLRVDELAKLLA